MMIIKQAMRLLQAPHRVLVAIPTTRATVDDCVAKIDFREVTIVADEGFVPGAVHPARYFSGVAKSNNNRRFSRAIIFTDQFVHAPESITPQIENGQRTYSSSVELVACFNHSVEVHAWTNQGFVMTAPNEQPLSQRHGHIAESMRSYYQSCDQLGSSWLARDRQIWRQHSTRLAHIARTIRRYESALMSSLGDSLLTEQYRSLLSCLLSRRASAIRELSAS